MTEKGAAEGLSSEELAEHQTEKLPEREEMSLITTGTASAACPEEEFFGSEPAM